MIDELEVRANKHPWSDNVDLVVFMKLHKQPDMVAVGKPIMFESLSTVEVIDTPTLSLNNHQAQNLIDELWRCGLRPSEGSGSAGMLAATERHLTDMKKITFGLLEKNDVKIT